MCDLDIFYELLITAQASLIVAIVAVGTAAGLKTEGVGDAQIFTLSQIIWLE